MEKLFGITFGIFLFCAGLWHSYKLKKGFVLRLKGRFGRKSFYVSVKKSDPMEVLTEILLIGFSLIFGIFIFLIYLNT